jgi:hypothetical protein
MTQISHKNKTATLFDLVDFSASTLCAIHCELLPFIITFFQENLHCDEKGHWWLDNQKVKKNSFSGKLIVLTSGACFSTSGHF